MENEKPEMPRTQPSAPVKPPSTTEDAPRRDASDEGSRPPRQGTTESDVRGDEMPAGADEPGAGL
jgi:hypothetical protein